jgi:hypothetical protein
VDLWKESLLLSQQMNDEAEVMRTCNLLGVAEEEASRLPEARAWFAHARQIAEARGDKQLLGAVLTNTVNIDSICLPGQKDDSLRSRSRVIEKVTKLLHEASRFCIDLSGAQEGLQGPCKVAHRLRVPRVNLEVMLECVRDRHECPLIVPAHSLDSSIDSAHFAKRLFVDVRDLVFHG